MPEVAHPARDYRLGDVVTGYVTRAHLRHPSTAPSRESTCERWPGTLACEYVSATPTDRNLTVLARLVEARNRDREWPNATTMTVHLRLGDVMEYEYYVRRGCRTACRYVRALDFYRGLAVPRSVRTAYVVTPRVIEALDGICIVFTSAHTALDGTVGINTAGVVHVQSVAGVNVWIKS